MYNHNSNRFQYQHPFRDDPYFVYYQMISNNPVLPNTSSDSDDASNVAVARSNRGRKPGRALEVGDDTITAKKPKVASTKTAGAKPANSENGRKPRTPKSDPASATTDSSAQVVAPKAARTPKVYSDTTELAGVYAHFAELFLGASPKDKKSIFKSFISDLAPL